MKKEQERKAAERRRIIEERCGRPKDLESANEGMRREYIITVRNIYIYIGFFLESNFHQYIYKFIILDLCS